MAVAGAIDANGQFTPEYAAYTTLVVFNRVQAEAWGHKVPDRQSMSFEQFLEAIKKEEIVDPNHARNVPSHELRKRDINIRMNGNPHYEMQAYHVIEKAYELGLVDYHGLLLSAFEAKA